MLSLNAQTYSHEHKRHANCAWVCIHFQAAVAYLMVYVQECVSCCLQTYYYECILLVPTKYLTAYIFVFFKEHMTALVG